MFIIIIKTKGNNMKSIITLICIAAATFAFGNGRCNNLHSEETGPCKTK